MARLGRELATTQLGEQARKRRLQIATWVAREVLPHEAGIRAWLARSRLSREDIDELIQESYCRLAMLDSVDHIGSPRAYFFSIARNLLLRRLRRGKIVSFETIAEIDSHCDEDALSPERQMMAKRDYARVLDMVAALPERCRRVIELRKIQGWSQKKIAEHLGTSEKAVEKQIWVGVRAIRDAWSRAERQAEHDLTELGLREERRR